MAILLTEPAAERVRNHLEARGSGLGLRIGVKKTGCNGFAYVVNYAIRTSRASAAAARVSASEPPQTVAVRVA